MHLQMKCRTLWDCYFWCLDWGLWEVLEEESRGLAMLSVQMLCQLARCEMQKIDPIFGIQRLAFYHCSPVVVEGFALGCDVLLEIKKRQ